MVVAQVTQIEGEVEAQVQGARPRHHELDDLILIAPGLQLLPPAVTTDS